MWLFLYCWLFVVTETTEKTLNAKIPLPDNDRVLQRIIYTTGVAYTNSKLPQSETNWWIPIPGHSVKASIVRTYDRQSETYYSTISYSPINARSVCNKNRVPLNNVKNCTLEATITHLQECYIVFAWTEGDWSTSEVEGICNISPNSHQRTFRASQISGKI